jgi:hypothetical protein
MTTISALHQCVFSGIIKASFLNKPKEAFFINQNPFDRMRDEIAREKHEQSLRSGGGGGGCFFLLILLLAAAIFFGGGENHAPSSPQPPAAEQDIQIGQ